jgi:hypothetical protein
MTMMRASVVSLVGVGLSTWGCGSDPRVPPDQPDVNQPDASVPDASPPDAGEPDASQPDGPGPIASQPLPVTISEHYIPGGYMGDGASSPTTIMISLTNCRQPRPRDATGDCYRTTYMPAAQGWAGIYWQYPERNWGTSPGKLIEAGATKVTFYAAGLNGGEVLEFLAGGIDDPRFPYRDSFKVTKKLTLTTTLTRYEIDISGRTYDPGVIGAFAWTFDTRGSRAPMEFYLDTIRWEK